MKGAPAYTSGCKRCNVSVEEKLCSMQGDDKNQLKKHRRSSPNVGIVRSSGQANSNARVTKKSRHHQLNFQSPDDCQRVSI